MDRTVPSTASEEIELYLRTVYSLLRSTTEVQLRTLEEVHAGMNSSLHPYARRTSPDTSAFIYCLLRLPDCMPKVRSVVLGQSLNVFAQHRFEDLYTWQRVSARARRRRCFYDGKETLACFIASRSDIDDIIPVMTTYQIEWNKLNHLLQRIPHDLLCQAKDRTSLAFSEAAKFLEMPVDDLDHLLTVWQDHFCENLERIASHRCSLGVRLLSGSLSEYWRATRSWWDKIEQSCPDLMQRPVYFISSNTHSIANLVTGFALHHQSELVNFLDKNEDQNLLAEWREILAQHVPSNLENFLYYVLKKFQQTPDGAYLVESQKSFELENGITRITSDQAFDIEAQVIELAHLKQDAFDPRLILPGCDFSCLASSNALILNIDYPLGYGAYNILAKVGEYVSPLLGVYVMGKAASLNGVRGDVVIPTVIQDEFSHNTYLFQNAFTAADVTPYLTYGTVLDNQKAVSVLGTFLQNARVMDVIYREGYTDIEMEAGPYLSGVYEMYRPQRHPINEIVNLYGVPFDVGILHYVSDTPLSKGKNLAAGTLSYFGMDSTYATSVAILRRIFQKEMVRLNN
jgi:hypothetical protein